MKKDDGIVTNLLMATVLVEFFVVELAVAVTVWKHPNPNIPIWIINAFTVSLVACLPAAAGFRAYSIVRKLRLTVDVTSSVKVKLSHLILVGIGAAYLIVSMVIVILS